MTYDLSGFKQKRTSGELGLLTILGYEERIVASTQTYKSQEEDKLSFMETFTFPKIEKFKNSLAKTGKYTETQISEILEGFEEFPEYKK